jgi:hypothetical protein
LTTAAAARHLKTTLDNRNAFGIAVAVVGTLLFVASRKLVWGRQESAVEPFLWLLAVAPYVAYYGAGVFVRSQRLADFLRATDFPAVWTASLLVFVVMRGTSLARFYEDAVYAAFDPGLVRYAILSVIYIGLGFAAVNAWELARARGPQPAPFARITAIVAGLLFFCCSVFLIAL